MIGREEVLLKVSKGRRRGLEDQKSLAGSLMKAQPRMK
jgi:hypothetical protein